MAQVKLNYNEKTVIIVGGGLSGCLQALYWSKKGYIVNIYESRPDPRSQKYYSGWRSMNLTLSERGLLPLRLVDAEDGLEGFGIRLYGRILHSLDGELKKRKYGNPNHYILSVTRQQLNQHLMNLADNDPNVNFHFEDKLIDADFSKGSAVFKNIDGTHTETCRLFIGSDGAYSKVRELLMKQIRMNYWQLCIPDGYKQLEMPPMANGEFAMDPHYLHIWPRSTFMLVALPNKNKTFTMTWFMSFEKFAELKTDEDIIKFFQKYFPDAFSLFHERSLVNQVHSYPANKLITIKCSPYHHSDKVVISGDAAHAMCPFYGQGVNCAFEDCMILHQILDQNNMDIEKSLAEYSDTRQPDAEAIVDLTLYNYIELRLLVNSKSFIVHQKVDLFLHWLMPQIWIPLYIMTQFTNIGYAEVVQRSKFQNCIISVIECVAGVSFLGIISSIGFALYKYSKN